MQPLTEPFIISPGLYTVQSNEQDHGIGLVQWSLLPLMVFGEQYGPCLNINTVFLSYGDSHAEDKTVERPSYL